MTNLLLNKTPAFGFESKHIKANRYKESESKRKFFITTTKSDGQYYTPSSRNLQKELGYIPLIGMIVGISRLEMLHKEMKEIKQLKKTGETYHRKFRPSTTIARGVIEALTLGILLLPVDVVVTGVRKIKQLSLK